MFGTSDLTSRFLGATDAELGIVRQPVYRVYIRNAAYQRVAELTDWTALDLEPVFNGLGSWSLETSVDNREARLLTKKGGIIVTREVNGVESTVFSGPVVKEYGFTPTTFRAAGFCDNYWLLEPARPNPNQAGPPFNQDYDVRTGVASSVMLQLVDVNIGPSAPAGNHKHPAIAFVTDPFLGTTITSRANMQPILTLLAELALTPYAGGLGFFLRQSDVLANTLEFQVYAPEDKSADAKFSIDLGTISDFEDTDEAPAGNRVFVLGGDGFGANRTVILEEDATSITEWGPLPAIVVDMRGTADPSELNQKAAEEIAKVSTLRRQAVTPFDVPSLQPGVDYDLGNLVSIVTPGGEVVDLIRRIEYSLDPEKGPKVTPIVGQGDGSDEERLATITRTIQDRLSNVERNWTVPPDSIDRSMLVPVLKPPIGEIKWLAHGTVPTGYLEADGQAVSRATYSLLFAAIGTTWGPGNGTTTFNVPDLIDRSPIGAGSSYSVGQHVGVATISGLAHTHPGSHSHGTVTHDHSGGAHTHPGSHSHGLEAHRHQMGHDHTVNIPNFDSGQRNNDSVGAFGFTEPNSSSGTEDHHHNVDPPSTTTSNSNNTDTGSGEQTDGGGAFDSTASDSNAWAASYSGATGTAAPDTEDDSSAHAASYSGGSASVVHPSAGLMPVVYAGV